MKKYHIGKNGPAVCRAKGRENGGRDCIYGAEGKNHYDSYEEAQKAYEAREEHRLFITHKSDQKNPIADDPLAEEILRELEDVTLDNLLEDLVYSSALYKRLHEVHGVPYSQMLEKLREKGEEPEHLNFYRAERLVKVGEKVSALAEKHGALTDEEISETVMGRFDELERGEVERMKSLHRLIQEQEDSDDEEEREVLQSEIDALRKKRQTLQIERDMQVEAVGGLFRERGDKYREVLASLGVVFAEDVEMHRRSQTKAVRAVHEAVKYYPKKWADASNDGDPFITKMSKKRAHYGSSTVQKFREQISRENVEMLPEDYPVDTESLEFLDAFPAEGETYDKIGRDGEVLYRRFAVAPAGKRAWVVPEYEVFHPTVGDPAPKGQRWKEREVKVKGENQKVFVREKRFTYAHEAVGIPEITLNETHNFADHQSRGTASAIHEFAHRVEDTNLEVAKITEGFLSRRGSGETPTTIGGRKGELGYRDSFTNHYMGKIYRKDTTSFFATDENPSTEILSMGMETLFSGMNGGFTDIFQNKEDKDYKHFMLGLLASSVMEES